jgi:hypothetical protein
MGKQPKVDIFTAAINRCDVVESQWLARTLISWISQVFPFPSHFPPSGQFA